MEKDTKVSFFDGAGNPSVLKNVKAENSFVRNYERRGWKKTRRCLFLMERNDKIEEYIKTY